MPGSSAISKESFDVQTANILREMIVTGNLEAGSRLVEAKLTEQFHVSRGTIRAALQKLHNEGLVSQVPYTGWHVIAIDAQDAWELHNLRRVLDGLAARLAAERIDPAGAKLLKAAYQRLCQACEVGDAKEIADADFEFHKLIVSLSGHRRLQEHYKLTEQQIRVFIASCDSEFSDYQNIGHRHEGLVEAILAGDADGAERLAKEHNATHGDALINSLRQMESQA
ncbi:HTH-type transcriptional regulator McbR [compost metagenome]|uniref:DNA-binding transcriptional regulator, GntR family n=1 Tax=Pseudomonas jinjuensis TaxID=198616 RepID=A0A1H0DLM1_9PSED|nr:GntR family transcriptional regulator [Pseudomonas jinjuensis]SDN71060.1 DNA-binding transcriptional regulator, GntR family [Pseudomonas jinjuensis]